MSSHSVFRVATYLDEVHAQGNERGVPDLRDILVRFLRDEKDDSVLVQIQIPIRFSQPPEKRK